MLQRVLHRASSRGFTPFYYDRDTLAENAHYHLFKHSCRQDHCLYHLYSVKPRPPGAMRLRTLGHDFELPINKYEFNKRNFIVQSLFSYVWFCVLLYYLHFVFYCTHMRMSYVLNSYLLALKIWGHGRGNCEIRALDLTWPFVSVLLSAV